MADRAALTGILFVLKTGIPWEDLPRKMGCGLATTSQRRLRDWREAGVRYRVRRMPRNRLRETGRRLFPPGRRHLPIPPPEAT